MSKIYDALENRDLGTVNTGHASTQVMTGNGPPDIEVYGLDAEMHSLYHSITTALPAMNHRSVLFVGARPKEGVSTIAKELARTVTSQLNKRVLFVDCQGSCEEFTYQDIDPSVRLEDILEKKTPLEKAICPVKESTLSVLPFFLWADSPRVQISLNDNGNAFWESLKQQFDLVIVDYPQEMFVNGSMMIPAVDGIIIVVEAERTRWQAALGLKEKIVGDGGNILGLVFNKRRYYIPQFIYDRL
jgi:protein-tyrosine kinase